MPYRSTFLSAVLLAAVPLMASDFEAQLGALRTSALAAKPAPAKFAASADENAIGETLTGMNDGNEVGESVVSYIQANKIRVAFAKQAEPASSKDGVIALSDALPRYPRVLAPLIAREAAKGMFAGMVDCAEKNYMSLSVEVRAWLELGGNARSQIVIEPLTGYANPAISASWGLWLDNGAEMALEKVGQATGTKIIPELEDYARRGEHRQKMRKLEEDNARFTDFLIKENEWRRTRP